MTRIVNALEEQRLVVRERDPDDARRTSIRATSRARAILTDGRARRVASLTTALDAFPQAERDALAGAVGVLERVIQML